MNEFVTWEIIGSYAGAVMVVGIVTQLLKYFPVIERIPTQILSYLLGFVVLTASQLALNTFSFASIGLNLVNAVLVSLAANGAYTGMTKVIANQEERKERETVVEVDEPVIEPKEEPIEDVREEEDQEELPEDSQI